MTDTEKFEPCACGDVGLLYRTDWDGMVIGLWGRRHWPSRLGGCSSTPRLATPVGEPCDYGAATPEAPKACGARAGEFVCTRAAGHSLDLVDGKYPHEGPQPNGYWARWLPNYGDVLTHCCRHHCDHVPSPAAPAAPPEKRQQDVCPGCGMSGLEALENLGKCRCKSPGPVVKNLSPKPLSRGERWAAFVAEVEAVQSTCFRGGHVRTSGRDWDDLLGGRIGQGFALVVLMVETATLHHRCACVLHPGGPRDCPHLEASNEAKAKLYAVVMAQMERENRR